jgi:hypothetical protein
MATQMCFQPREVGMGIDVGTEVHADALIVVDVVTVSVKHI